MKINKLMLAFLILTLVQAACNLPITPRVQPAETGTSTQLPPLATAVQEIITPAFVLAEPSATRAVTPEASQTPVATITPSFTPEPNTLTPTATLEALLSAVTLSTQVISSVCDPKVVRFEATSARQDVFSVVLFYRLRYKASGEQTAWNAGLVMKPLAGVFVYDLQAVNIKEFNKFKETAAWLQYQLVATDRQGNILGRSQVFADRLTIIGVCP
ncbi:MAG: hypothetical protein NTW32_09050 [Chloroflexi bacterium]|nr:hypothetical protein [Chloroflexota bacterium]